LLHDKYLKIDIFVEDSPEECFVELGFNDLQRLEIQANLFASYLLVPDEAVIRFFDLISRKMVINNKGHGKLYIDSQPGNQTLLREVENEYQREFGVSRVLIRNRLKSLGILVFACGYFD
jgi:Zn-dependent peptidase ImmA (M78 family)